MALVIRKRAFLSVLLAGLLITAGILVLGPATRAQAGDMLVLEVDVTLGGGFQFDDADGDGLGSFYIDGVIVDDMGNPIGHFDCWGRAEVDGDGNPIASYVSQEYSLDGRGSIMTQGIEIGADSIAVVGGKGEFRNVRGEAVFGGAPNGFTIAFSKRKG